MASKDYIKLTNYGIHPRVALELCRLFDTGNVSPLDLDKMDLHALKEVKVNEAITVIKIFSKLLENSKVKNKSGYLCAMIESHKQRRKPPSQDPAMQFVLPLPNTPAQLHPNGQWRQSNTNRGQGRQMYVNQEYNQQSNQHQEYNRPQIQYQGYNKTRHSLQYYHGLVGITSASSVSAQNMQKYVYKNELPQNIQGENIPSIFYHHIATSPRQRLATCFQKDIGKYYRELPLGEHHPSSPQRGDLQIPDREKSPIYKRDKEGEHKHEENEIQDHIMSRNTTPFEEINFIKTKQSLSEELKDVDQTESSLNLQMHTNQYMAFPINQLVDPHQYVSPTHSEQSSDYPHSTGRQSFSNNLNYLWSSAKSSNKMISMDKSGQSSNLQMNTVQAISFLNVSEMESSHEPSIYHRPKENRTLTTKQSYLQLRTTHSNETPAVLGAHSDKHSSLLTSPLLCDGMYIDCITDKRLDTRTAFFSSVQDEDTYCLLSELEKTQPDEFACLVHTSHYLKTRKSLQSTVLNQLFRYSILNGSSLMCRLILSFITYNVKAELYLIQMMFLALDKVKKDCARAISWFITRAFYLQYQSLLKELIDIWPSFCCPCSKRLKSSACSTEVVIVVELENDCPQLPKQFCQLQIISIRNDDILRSDGPDVHKELSTSNGSLHLPQNEAVSSVMAKELFTKHSKLTLICKSFRKSKGYKNGKLDYILSVPCVQLYCSAKGCIPIGEDHFPKDVCGLPTDILQGTPSLMANLKVGDKIGTDNYKMGTLGGFVKVRGDVCFLTCLHVFLSAEDLASDNISLDDDAGVIVKCYSTGSVTGQGQMIPYECGRIREIAFEMDNERETSIDAALITLNDRSQIDENDYLASNIDKTFTIRDLGMKSKYLNENCIDFKPLCYSIPCPKVEVVAVGAITGICNAEAQVKENNEKSIELESIEQTFSNVILTELKEKVGQVIELLRGQAHNITCDQIWTIIGQVCEPSISDEFKSVILDIINNILPRIIKRQSQNGNTNTNNNHEDAIFCSTCAELNQPMCMCFHGMIDEMVISKSTSHLSSIFSDVHMQRTFLRRTGDQQSLKRTSRRVYNQIHVSNIPFKPGDSGSCIYTVQPSAGCIGMAIANHPQSGCIATPIKEILKHFKIKIK